MSDLLGNPNRKLIDGFAVGELLLISALSLVGLLKRAPRLTGATRLEQYFDVCHILTSLERQTPPNSVISANTGSTGCQAMYHPSKRLGLVEAFPFFYHLYVVDL
eukprot:290881-Amphidinium_carterae.2